MDFFGDLQESLLEQTKKKYEAFLEEEKSKPPIDHLRMYFGSDLKVNKFISIHQPTIGEILDFADDPNNPERDNMVALSGESKLFSSIAPFTGNSTTYKIQLWHMDPRIDWNDLTNDYDVFLIMYQTMRPEITSLVFGDQINFQKLIPMQTVVTGEKILVMEVPEGTGSFTYQGHDYETVIDEITYTIISQYLRTMFNQFPKVQFATGSAKKSIIEKEEREMMERAMRGNGHNSFLLPLISACLNHPGFKYKKSELRDIGYVEFMDSAQRLPVYEQSIAYLHGLYSGFMDTSKVPQKTIERNTDWMRDIYEK